MNLKFQFLQTVANFLYQAITIDSNKDKKISGAEIQAFVFGVIVPLLTSANLIRSQAEAFFDFVRGLTFEKFKELVLEIIDQNLLPDQLSKQEEMVDEILQAIFDVIVSIENARNVFNKYFGNRELEIRIKKKGSK